MQIFCHGNCDADVEGVAGGCAAVEDEIAGDRALGDADGGAGGTAECDGDSEVADGGARDVVAVRFEVLAVDVDFASGHGGEGRDAIKVRSHGVWLVVRQEGAESRHTGFSVAGCARECN
jgi:hypothetical protein